MGSASALRGRNPGDDVCRGCSAPLNEPWVLLGSCSAEELGMAGNGTAWADILVFSGLMLTAAWHKIVGFSHTSGTGASLLLTPVHCLGPAAQPSGMNLLPICSAFLRNLPEPGVKNSRDDMGALSLMWPLPLLLLFPCSAHGENTAGTGMGRLQGCGRWDKDGNGDGTGGAWRCVGVLDI